jgi:tetratricopeptide (TPR) repeat protein
MKKTLFLLGGLVISLATTAQVKTPQLSPKAEVEQTVGLTKFEVEYSRPSLRDRDLHKDILPIGEAWRFGANKNSTISFDTQINFGGKDVKAGEYAMFAVPGEKEWKITLYSGTDNWGLPEKWENEKVVAEVLVPVKTNKNSVETFTISFDNLDVNHFDLVVEWGNTMLPIKVKLPTGKLTVASIKETMKGSPSERDYYNAANYYLHANTELNEALKYVNKAIEMNGEAPFYYIRNKALILKAMGKDKEAIEAAKLSLEKATAAGSAEYIRKNQESIKEWSK